MKRSIQLDYSDLHCEAYYGKGNRERKALTILSILEQHLGAKLHASKVLDVGSSTGFIDNILADHVSSMVGLDIDQKAIRFAQETFKKQNLSFEEGDALSLKYKDGSFDIVICNHVYEHVVDDEMLLNEISRVLKKQGICFFSAGNSIRLIEPHYGLPFLSVIPRSLAHFYLKIARRGDYYHEKHRTYWGLTSLVRNFDAKDYTAEIVNYPARYCAEYMLQEGTIKQRIAKIVCKYLLWICPTYVWVLQKKDE